VTRVLLVTGARSLATRPGAEAWALDTPTRRATRGTEPHGVLARAAGLSVREEVWRGAAAPAPARR
jgi:hypothetical protein